MYIFSHGMRVNPKLLHCFAPNSWEIKKFAVQSSHCGKTIEINRKALNYHDIHAHDECM